MFCLSCKDNTAKFEEAGSGYKFCGTQCQSVFHGQRIEMRTRRSTSITEARPVQYNNDEQILLQDVVPIIECVARLARPAIGENENEDDDVRKTLDTFCIKIFEVTIRKDLDTIRKMYEKCLEKQLLIDCVLIPLGEIWKLLTRKGELFLNKDEIKGFCQRLEKRDLDYLKEKYEFSQELPPTEFYQKTRLAEQRDAFYTYREKFARLMETFGIR